MKNTKTKVIIVMCVALLVMATGYAFFATNLNITTTGNITTTWKVNFTSISEGSNGGTTGSNAITPTFTDTTATMSANLKVPGDYMEYDLVLKNSGGINAIIESIDANATGSPAIIFSISGLNEGDRLARNDQKTMKIRIEYDPSVTSQPSETTKTLTVSIKAVQDTGQEITPSEPNIDQLLPSQLKYKILSDNIAYADNVSSPYVSASTGINFSAISSDTNGKGLYYTSTNTEDNKTTYYFRGAVENNYVQFGVYKAGTTVNVTTYNIDTPIYWKIIRINEDGSIRLIYNGTSTTATGNNVTIGTSKFNTNYDDNAYVGYMYGTPSSSTYALTHANTNDSTIKDYLDEWYIENLSSYSSYLADAGFCNDRSMATSTGLWNSSDTALGYGINLTYYGAHNRLENEKQPQFACPNASNDLFTTNTSTKGNKALTNPIGLITADEVWYAGAATSTNQTHYLYTDSIYWTMSPEYFSGSIAYEWCVSPVGNMFNEYVHDDSRYVRPVINLKPTVELSKELPEGCTKLDGTEACPYIIETK